MASVTTQIIGLITIFGMMWHMTSADVTSDVRATCPSCTCMTQIESINERMQQQDERIICLENGVDELVTEVTSNIWDCDDVEESSAADGIYQIQPEGSPRGFDVSCIFDTDGKWTVLQRRLNGSTSFNRAWAEYKRGFGANGLDTELWLGLEKMHLLTSQRQYTLRIDLTDWDDVVHYAQYEYVNIGDEASNYRLHFQGHSGTLQDKLSLEHNDKPFTTFDRDNENSPGRNCAQVYQGAWWHWSCYHVNLNGPYRTPPNHDSQSAFGIQWYQFRGPNWYSMKKSVMRIKPTFTDPLR